MTESTFELPPLVGRRTSILRHLPVALLSGLYLFAASIKASRRPLWFDEIITFNVSVLDSPRAIVEALLGRIDIHPPLDYIVRHLSMALLGQSEFAFRLPSILALLVAALSLYFYVLRRTSLLPALVAFALPFSTVALSYSYEGRAYSFLMAAVCLSLLAWQLAAEKPTIARLVFLTAALGIGPFFHYYGVLNFAPVVAGEAWRCWERRRVSWPIVASICVSLAPLALLVPFALAARGYSDAFWTRVSPIEVAYGYVHLLRPAIPAAVGGILSLAVVGLLPSKDGKPPAPAKAVPRAELVAAIVLCLLPFITYVVAETVTRVYGYKYTLNTIFGVTLLVAYGVHLLNRRREIAAVLVVLSICLWSAAMMGRLAKTPAPAPRPSEREVALIAAAETPVLVLGELDFLEIFHQLPAPLRNKIYYASDRKLARRHSGEDTGQRALEDLARFVPLNLVSLCDFTRENRHFTILMFRPYWLLDKLANDGASVKFLSGQLAGTSVLEVQLQAPSGC